MQHIISEEIDIRLRSEQVFAGTNYVHFNSERLNYITLPIIPPKD